MSSYQALISNAIYFGGADGAPDAVEKEKIDVIYDLRVSPPEEANSLNRVHAPILEDAENQDESIKAAVNQIIQAYQAGNKVYFHCSGGRGRAGAAAIGTLLALGEATTFEEAEEKVKAIREVVNVPEAFKAALKRVFLPK